MEKLGMKFTRRVIEGYHYTSEKHKKNVIQIALGECLKFYDLESMAEVVKAALVPYISYKETPEQQALNDAIVADNFKRMMGDINARDEKHPPVDGISTLEPEFPAIEPLSTQEPEQSAEKHPPVDGISTLEPEKPIAPKITRTLRK